MADKKHKTDLDIDIKTEDTPKEETVEEKKAKPKKIVMWKVLFLIGPPILLFVAIAIFIFAIFFKEEEKKVEPKVIIKEKKEEVIIITAPIYNLGNFFIPINSSKTEDTLLKMEINLELSNEQLKVELDKIIIQIRSNIFKMFKKMALNEINTRLTKGALENDIINLINISLHSGKVTKVSFQEFFTM